MLSLESQRETEFVLREFVLPYNKSRNDWSLEQQGIVSLESQCLRFEGNSKFVARISMLEIRGKQNSLLPSGPVIKC